MDGATDNEIVNAKSFDHRWSDGPTGKFWIYDNEHNYVVIYLYTNMSYISMHTHYDNLTPIVVGKFCTAHVPVIPSSRRGHSFQLIDNLVYMFGGRTDGYSCASVWRDTINLGTYNWP